MIIDGIRCCLFFFFKQKTAYEIVSGDWSSDVCSSDLLAKAEVRRQHGHAVGELAGAKADELLGQRASGTQLLGGAGFHGTPGADQHCGERHSLGDDTQADDQHEKPFAETTHEFGSNMLCILRAMRYLLRGLECGNETSGTPASHRVQCTAGGRGPGAAG